MIRTMMMAAMGTFLLAGTAVRAQAAQAYVVNEIEVTDPATFQTYSTRQGALIQSFGGRFLARGGAAETIAGSPVQTRIVIYAFDSVEKMHAWRAAPEQAALIALRDKSSHFRSFAVEGVAN